MPTVRTPLQLFDAGASVVEVFVDTDAELACTCGVDPMCRHIRYVLDNMPEDGVWTPKTEATTTGYPVEATSEEQRSWLLRSLSILPEPSGDVPAPATGAHPG